MNRLEEMVVFNKEFVNNEEYKKYETSKYPDKKMVILSCMDTRLISLLPKALNLKNGDAKIVKNAGAVITHPFGSIMRSILVAVYELQADEVFVIGHKGCGMSSLEAGPILEKMYAREINESTVTTLKHAGIDIDQWLHGFDCVEESVKESVNQIRNHPLMSKDIRIHGLIMDPLTGGIQVVVDGNKEFNM